MLGCKVNGHSAAQTRNSPTLLSSAKKLVIVDCLSLVPMDSKRCSNPNLLLFSVNSRFYCSLWS